MLLKSFTSAIMRAKACSAVVIVLAEAAFMTAIPRRVAASRSMLSTPTPARAIARSRQPGSPTAHQICPTVRILAFG